MDTTPVVAVALLVLAAGSVFAAFQGWRHAEWRWAAEQWRSLPRPVLAFAVLAILAGAIGGVLLAIAINRCLL